jgi:hypothetical protein
MSGDWRYRYQTFTPCNWLAAAFIEIRARQVGVPASSIPEAPVGTTRPELCLAVGMAIVA